MDNIAKIKDFFDELANSWDERNSDEAGAKKIVKQFKTRISNKDVLDVGCGTGVLYQPLTNAGAKSITAIDLSDEMINLAKEKFPQGNFICEDILKWNTEQMFDTIIMYNVYPHLMDKKALVDKIYSLLNAQGTFIVAHGSSRDTINSHHSSHAMEVSRKLLKAQEEAEIWRTKFSVEIIRDDDLYYFSGTKK